MRKEVEATIASAESIQRTIDELQVMQEIVQVTSDGFYDPDWASYPDARFEKNVAFHPSAASS